MMRDLTRGKPLGLIATFAVSLLAANLMSQIYSLVDSVMVGRLVAPEGIGAIDATGNIIGVASSLGGGIISGFGITLGRYWGAGQADKLRRVMANIWYLTTAMSLLLMVLVALTLRPMLRLTHVPEELLPMALDYTYIVIFSMPLSFFGGVFGTAFRSLGDSKTPLLTSLVGGAVNVGYNYLFMRVVPLGIAGAAIGTALSAGTSLLLNLFFFFRRLPMLRVRRADARPLFGEMGRLFLVGFPVGLQNSITGISGIVLQDAINRQGMAAVTGVATGNKIVGMIWVMIATLETTLIFYAAQNRGALEVGRIRQGMRQTAFVTLAMMAVITLGVNLLGKRLFVPFVGHDEALLTIAADLTRTQLWFFPFMVMLSMLRGTVQGMGYTAPAAICGVMELTARFIVSRMAKTLRALYFAGPAAWVLTTLFLAVLYPFLLHRLNRRVADEKALRSLSIDAPASAETERAATALAETAQVETARAATALAETAQIETARAEK